MADCLPYKNIPYYSELIVDYLDEKKALQPFYHRYPNLQNFKAQAEEKAASFTTKNRKILVETLQKQYKQVNASKKTNQHIAHLRQENTFTVTTGHQLNLFTGPLYFFYKIISVINLTNELKQAYPENNFVPLFWMASEDHDFEEINYFNFKGKQLFWDSDQKGPVGRFSTEGLEQVYKVFAQELNTSDHAESLRHLFKEAYLKHDTLTKATRYLANAIFKDYGLVIIDGDDASLKSLFSKYIKDELLQETAFQHTKQSAKNLDILGYKVQVNPREINLFYIKDGLRERIVKKEHQYFVNETSLQFSEAEILTELDNHPERFSPNALMRPLYQEVVLPNLAYIGGSGELAYWLELKDYFKKVEVVFPCLLMRNSALLIAEKQDKKRQELQLTKEDLFLPQADLITQQTKAISAIPIDFSLQKKYLRKQFEDLYTLSEKTDQSFIGAVAAQEQKQLNGLAHLEKRLLKAQKRKLKDELARSTKLQDALFPHGNLQERQINFSEVYEIHGDQMLSKLFKTLSPINDCFNLIVL